MLFIIIKIPYLTESKLLTQQLPFLWAISQGEAEARYRSESIQAKPQAETGPALEACRGAPYSNIIVTKSPPYKWIY